MQFPKDCIELFKTGSTSLITLSNKVERRFKRIIKNESNNNEENLAQIKLYIYRHIANVYIFHNISKNKYQFIYDCKVNTTNSENLQVMFKDFNINFTTENYQYSIHQFNIIECYINIVKDCKIRYNYSMKLDKVSPMLSLSSFHFQIKQNKQMINIKRCKNNDIIVQEYWNNKLKFEKLLSQNNSIVIKFILREILLTLLIYVLIKFI